MKSEVKKILETFLVIMKEMDSDSVVSALGGVIEHFGDEITPFAMDILHHLKQNFMHLVQKDEDEDSDEDGEIQMAAYSVLCAIRKILVSPLKIEVYLKAFYLIEPIILHCFSTKGLDYLDEAAPLLGIFVYKIYPLPEEIWFYFPILCYILAGNPNQ